MRRWSLASCLLDLLRVSTHVVTLKSTRLIGAWFQCSVVDWVVCARPAPALAELALVVRPLGGARNDELHGGQRHRRRPDDQNNERCLRLREALFERWRDSYKSGRTEWKCAGEFIERENPGDTRSVWHSAVVLRGWFSDRVYLSVSSEVSHNATSSLGMHAILTSSGESPKSALYSVPTGTGNNAANWQSPRGKSIQNRPRQRLANSLGLTPQEAMVFRRTLMTSPSESNLAFLGVT